MKYRKIGTIIWNETGEGIGWQWKAQRTRKGNHVVRVDKCGHLWVIHGFVAIGADF